MGNVEVANAECILISSAKSCFEASFVSQL